MTYFPSLLSIGDIFYPSDNSYCTLKTAKLCTLLENSAKFFKKSSLTFVEYSADIILKATVLSINFPTTNFDKFFFTSVGRKYMGSTTCIIEAAIHCIGPNSFVGYWESQGVLPSLFKYIHREQKMSHLIWFIIFAICAYGWFGRTFSLCECVCVIFNIYNILLIAIFNNGAMSKLFWRIMLIFDRNPRCSPVSPFIHRNPAPSDYFFSPVCPYSKMPRPVPVLLCIY